MDSVSESQDSRTVASQTANAGPPENVMIAVNPSQQLLTDFANVADASKHPPLAGGELEAPTAPPSEFDFSLPCQYFKSSFARSLSLNNSSGCGANQSKSLDYINANKNGLQPASPPPSSSAATNRKCTMNYEICPRTNPPGIAIGAVPPIPARRQNIETSAVIPTASAVNGTHHLRNSCGSNISTSTSTNRVTAGNGNGSINSSMTCRVPHVANAVNGNFVRRNVCWPPAPPSSASSSGEQECQLLDEAEHEMKITGEYAENRFDVVDPSTSVEAVILQNQIDTLQWQLKQAETSCGMYRAVMEEVARFLDRFQKTSAHCRTEQISRSKSMYHVYGEQDKGSDSGNSSAYLRARSSTNLIDLKRMSPSPFGDESIKSSGEEHYSIASPISPYNTFKDFTYRRSPKKRGDQKLSPGDEIEEKLSKEAFRLSRTINNLLNTQQPDLTQHRQSLGPRIKTPPSNGNVMPDVAVHQKTSLSAEMLFLRTINMRDSRLSLRSSTDSSVHSTSSSSKVETDEENYSPPPPLLSKQCSNLCSTTEDESGFSSISSFQEIGVPLSSTMISSSTGSGSSHLDDTIDQSDFNLDSRNSTLKAATMHAHSTPNNVGLPLASHDANRWDMKTYRNKCQRFSTLSNEDSSTVLWV